MAAAALKWNVIEWRALIGWLAELPLIIKDFVGCKLHFIIILTIHIAFFKHTMFYYQPLLALNPVVFNG